MSSAATRSRRASSVRSVPSASTRPPTSPPSSPRSGGRSSDWKLRSLRRSSSRAGSGASSRLRARRRTIRFRREPRSGSGTLRPSSPRRSRMPRRGERSPRWPRSKRRSVVSPPSSPPVAPRQRCWTRSRAKLECSTAQSASTSSAGRESRTRSSSSPAGVMARGTRSSPTRGFIQAPAAPRSPCSRPDFRPTHSRPLPSSASAR